MRSDDFGRLSEAELRMIAAGADLDGSDRKASFHDALVAERNAQYNNAWRTTGLWIAKNHEALAAAGSMAFCLVMIQNKVERALATPENRDHYDDIIGYAKLVLKELGAEEKS